MAAAALVALAGCSDPERVPDGERFTLAETGIPGVALIDDMEDGSQYLLSDNGMTGLWYTYNDASLNAVQEPSLGFPMYRILRDDGSAQPGSVIPPRPCGPAAVETPFFASETTDDCRFVARSWGTGQRGWGAGMGLDLNGEAGEKNPYDASAYAGIGFFAYGSMRGNALRVNIQDVRTTPESAQAADRAGIARCTDTATSRCNDHFGTSVAVPPGAWKWIEIPFACMTPGGWGFPGGGAPFLANAVVGIQFQIQGQDPADTGMPAMGSTIQPFDIAIDNLSFLEPGRVATPPVCPTAP
ncbi:MAG TPA: hypothetical protein VMG12_33260 [Polyangiaceae bacterium]|nr:hypothetical protein [Polyangiaceae bacterium]